MAEDRMNLVLKETRNGVTTRHYTYQGLNVIVKSTPPSDAAIKRLASALLKAASSDEDGKVVA